MKENLISLIAYAIEFFVVFTFFNSLFLRKKEGLRALFFGAFLFLVCWVVFILFSNTIINVILYFISIVLFALLFFEVKIIHALLSSLFLTASMMAIEFIVMNILSLSISKDINAYKDSTFIYLLFTIINKTLYLVITKIALIMGIYLKEKKNSHFPFFLLIYPICSMIILYTFWMIAVEYHISYLIKVLILIASIAIIVSILLTFVFQSKTSKEIDELFNAQQNAERIRTDTTYYALLDSQNEKLKAITHEERIT